MNTIIALLAIYGLAFTIKQADGPWSIIARWRNWMMRLPFVGVPLFNLLACYYCLGCWTGLAVYLLTNEPYKLAWAAIYFFGGGAVSLFIDAVLNRLWRD